MLIFKQSRIKPNQIKPKQKEKIMFFKISVFFSFLMFEGFVMDTAKALGTTDTVDIRASWDNVSDDRVVKYKVYMGNAASRVYNKSYTIKRPALGITPSVIIRNLKINTIYYLAVTSLTAIGEESDFSEEIVFSTTPINLGTTLHEPSPEYPNGALSSSWALPGGVCDVEKSNDLVTWVVVGDAIDAKNGIISFMYAIKPEETSVFLRIKYKTP